MRWLVERPDGADGTPHTDLIEARRCTVVQGYLMLYDGTTQQDMETRAAYSPGTWMSVVERVEMKADDPCTSS